MNSLSSYCIKRPEWALLCFILMITTILPTASAGHEFDLNVKATALSVFNGTAISDDQNPGNRYARIPDNHLVLAVTPEMSLVQGNLFLSATPRLEMMADQVTIEGHTRHSHEKNIRLMEFMVQQGISENLFISYGRENLQWGPSFLYSPSNPFFDDNGKKQLVQDLEGKGFLKLVRVHDYSWTTSLIYNTDRGAVNEPDFEKTLALKIDYSGNDSYGALILSHTDHKKTLLGAFAGTTVSDAVILYGEASLQQETGTSLHQTDHIRNAVFLAGVGYTFASADTLTVEYLYYGPGNDAGDIFDAGRQNFLQQHYLMVQYLDEDISAGFDLAARVSLCMDDGSSRFYAALSRDLNDHAELKISGMADTGGPDKAFGTFMDYQIQVALEYWF